MFVVVVYDTLAERNPAILKTCRRYLHWVQRSVFQGELSAAQYRSFTEAIKHLIDPSYDSVLIYRMQGPHMVRTETIGQKFTSDSPVL
ncbi:CRISPR-associated protein, Cas2 family [Marinactinospora thermotolerans DSM 45154]|uniref:CRISPR-associated endoribonuclease Cas2 n=1 Tax=Marinactinospora thermotolerans DSM 45154 TaxID=1122192 RepID=A0A1T4S5M1_9ACTN|nr:CRISPR-associated endonuclease Cas2 [Marinactinospora thermotolerans]SKA23151.1 CRISPR-associated protein, Cas2 family [Marinactinospora thermotolerans DSM 45154]